MLQTRNSRWTVATGLICVVILAASWFLLVSPRRAEAADLRDQRTQAASANNALQVQIAQLKAQFADLPARQAELATIQTQLPGKADLPKLIRDIDRLTKSSGIELKSITPQPAAPVLAEGQAPAAASGSALYALPTTITATGDYFEAAQFIRLVQTDMPRAFLVTGITVEGVDEEAGPDGIVDLTLAGQIYVLMDSAAQAQAAAGAVTDATGATGATPGGVATTPTASPSPSASASSGTGSSGSSATSQESPAATPTPTTTASSN